MKLATFRFQKARMRALGVLAAFLMAAWLFPAVASAVPITVTITDTATGSATPPLSSGSGPGSTTTNGDFTIIEQGGSKAGNGSDERTLWTFDFNADPGLATFTAPGMGLISAQLTLTIHTTDSLVASDDVLIDAPGFDPLFLNTTLGLTVPVPTGPGGFTFTVELLDYYDASAIMSLFLGSGNTLPFKYSDDAIVSFAQLQLTATELPEPTSLLLLGTGLVGFAAWRLRRKETA